MVGPSVRQRGKGLGFPFLGVLLATMALGGCRRDKSGPPPEAETKSSPAPATTADTANGGTGANKTNLAHEGGAGAGEVLLFDFSQPRKHGDGAPLPYEVSKAIFPAGLRDASTHCPIPPGDLAGARRLGAASPVVDSLKEGSFGGPGQKETAYLVHVGECNGTHADGFGSKRLVVLNQGRVVANLEVPFEHLETTRDVDGDGVDELLLSGGGMGQGLLVLHAQLANVKPDRLLPRRAFDEVLTDGCGSSLGGNEASGSRISYVPGQKGELPAFHMERVRSTCSP